MTLILDLSPELEQRLAQEAAKAGLPAEAYALKTLEERLGDNGRKSALELSTSSPAAQLESDWMLEWNALAEQISRAWKSDRSAVEILDEMRR